MTRSLVVAVDPGVTTGLATVTGKDDSTFKSWQVDEAEMYQWFDMHGQEIKHVQCEKFTITAATIRKTVVYDSLYLIGYLRYAAYRNGFTLAFTKPADVMAPFPDVALKRAGMHTPGLGHANDAARHLAHYMVRHGRSGSDFLPKAR